MRRFRPAGEQTHQLFAVVDYRGEPTNIEAGAGFGLNSATDRLTIKLTLSRDLNAPPAAK